MFRSPLTNITVFEAKLFQKNFFTQSNLKISLRLFGVVFPQSLVWTLFTKAFLLFHHTHTHTEVVSARWVKVVLKWSGDTRTEQTHCTHSLVRREWCMMWVCVLAGLSLWLGQWCTGEEERTERKKGRKKRTAKKQQQQKNKEPRHLTETLNNSAEQRSVVKWWAFLYVRCIKTASVLQRPLRTQHCINAVTEVVSLSEKDASLTEIWSQSKK